MYSKGISLKICLIIISTYQWVKLLCVKADYVYVHPNNISFPGVGGSPSDFKGHNLFKFVNSYLETNNTYSRTTLQSYIFSYSFVHVYVVVLYTIRTVYAVHNKNNIASNNITARADTPSTKHGGPKHS